MTVATLPILERKAQLLRKARALERASVPVAIPAGFDPAKPVFGLQAQELQRRVVLGIARSKVGVREVGGENQGRAVATFLAAAGIHVPAPWCQAFLVWCLREAGYPGPLAPLPAYVPSWVAFAAQHRWLVPVRSIRPGDWIAYQNDGDPEADHVGVAASAVHLGLLQAVEGNTSADDPRVVAEGDVVALKRWRRASSIQAAWRIAA